MHLLMKPTILQRLPLAFVQPDTSGDRAAVDLKRQVIADAVTGQQATGLRAEQGAPAGIIYQLRRVALGERPRPIGILALPIDIGLERNPNALRTWALEHAQTGFDFLFDQDFVGVERAF